MANPQIVKTPGPFTPEVNTRQAGTKANIRFSRFRPIGRVFHNTTVKAVPPLTILSLPALGWPVPGVPASARRTQPSFRDLTPLQSIEAYYQTSFLPAFFERLKSTCIFALIGLIFPAAYTVVALTTTLATQEHEMAG